MTGSRRQPTFKWLRVEDSFCGAKGGSKATSADAATHTNGSFGECTLGLKLNSGLVWPYILEERYRSDLRSIKGMVKIGPIMVAADDMGGKSETAEGLEL